MNIGFEAKRIFHNKTGLGNYSRDLIRILSQYFPENNYFLYNPKSSNNDLFFVNNTNVFEKKPKKIFKNFKNLWRQYAIKNDLLKDHVAIFHGLSGEIPIGLKSKNIKSVVTIHDLIFIKFPNLYSFFDRKIHYYKFKKAAQESDCIVAISEQTKNDIINYLKIEPSKIRVIYQGCSDIFKQEFSEREKNEVREKYNLPDQFILNVGTIETRKNIFIAVKAIKDIDTTLVIVGAETPYSAEIKKYVDDNSLGKKVIFAKNLDKKELAILYQMSQLLVYPSIYEGFGIPIIEALYSRTPVITTIGGVFPEAGGPDSIYVDPTSVDEMRKAILSLLENEKLRIEIANKGYEFAQKFNDNVIAENWMSLYKSLI